MTKKKPSEFQPDFLLIDEETKALNGFGTFTTFSQ